MAKLGCWLVGEMRDDDPWEILRGVLLNHCYMPVRLAVLYWFSPSYVYSSCKGIIGFDP
jgi:hypothetical protein